MWIWLFHSVPWYMYKSMRFRNVRWLLNDNALNLIILCFVSVDLTWMGTSFCITAFLLTLLFVSYSKHAQSFSIYKVVLYLIHDMLVQESNKSILLFTKIRKWPKRITLSETYIPYFQWFHEAQYSVSRKTFNLQYKQIFLLQFNIHVILIIKIFICRLKSKVRNGNIEFRYNCFQSYIL